MRQLIQRKSTLSTTPINMYELYHGAHVSLHSEENLEKVRNLLSMLQVLPLDDVSCEKGGHIRAILESRGEKIGDADSLIAGTACRHGETIVTRNVKHFSKVEGLLVEVW